MPWTAPPAAPRCPACNASVFPAEAFMAADRRPFHKKCVKCSHCAKILSPGALNEHGGQLFCNLCYANIFLPQEEEIPERMPMQVLPVGGIYTAIEEEKRRRREEQIRKEMEQRAKKEGGCPTCCQKANGPDTVVLSGIAFHKACLRCATCSRVADPTTPMTLGPKGDGAENVFGEEELEPYCNFCFARKFKISAINIAETVNIVGEDTSIMSL